MDLNILSENTESMLSLFDLLLINGLNIIWTFAQQRWKQCCDSLTQHGLNIVHEHCPNILSADVGTMLPPFDLLLMVLA